MSRDPWACDASELGRGFATGRLDPRTVLEASLARIAACDDVVGACNHRVDAAVLRAEAADSATRWRNGNALSVLDGVPFGVKANIAVRGMPWHAGVGALKDRHADRDAACVARMRAAGMIPVAIFNMHEAALGVTTDNPAFGTTRNPHDPAHIAGGSSGGSAAAVAAGMVPVALGTDSLGSVRLPSAFCGIVGYKPARGEIPLQGVVPLAARLDHVGVHARSVADVAAVMALFSRAVDPPLDRPVTEPDALTPPDVYGQVACPTAVGESTSVLDRTRLARWQAATGLQSRLKCAFERFAGAFGLDSTVDWSDLDLGKVRRAGLVACERGAARHFARTLRDNPDAFSTEFRDLVAWAADLPTAKLRQTEGILDATSTRLHADLAETLLIGPTAPCTAPAHGAVVDPDIANLTAPAAIAGVPSLSIPFAAGSGLPLGMQVTGLNGNDVLQVGQSLFPGEAPVGPI